jgi:hypothetical protein
MPAASGNSAPRLPFSIARPTLAPELASRLLGRETRSALAVRAEDVHLEPDGSTATLERIVPFGVTNRAVVLLDGSRLLIDTPLAGLRPGSLVDLRIDEAAVRSIG